MIAVVLYGASVSVPNADSLKHREREKQNWLNSRITGVAKMQKTDLDCRKKTVPKNLSKKFGRTIDQIAWNEFLKNKSIFLMQTKLIDKNHSTALKLKLIAVLMYLGYRMSTCRFIDADRWSKMLMNFGFIYRCISFVALVVPIASMGKRTHNRFYVDDRYV